MNWPAVEMSLPLSKRQRVGKRRLRKLQMSLLERGRNPTHKAYMQKKRCSRNHHKTEQQLPVHLLPATLPVASLAGSSLLLPLFDAIRGCPPFGGLQRRDYTSTGVYKGYTSMSGNTHKACEGIH